MSTTGHPDPVSWTDVGRDIRLALADGRPTGPAADALRDRLRQYIHHFLPDADQYAKTLAEGRPRDIAENTVRHARNLAEATGTHSDPSASLRLLAKATDYTARYAASACQAGAASPAGAGGRDPGSPWPRHP